MDVPVQGQPCREELRDVHTVFCRIQGPVAFEACKEDRTLAQLSREFGVSPEQICRWKKKLQSNAAFVFSGKQMKKNLEEPSAALYQEIGRLKMELDRLKKSN
jgi:Transposase.